jgi:5,10-methylenetetrahydrofolate reductase
MMLFRDLLISGKKTLTVEYNPPKGSTLTLTKLKEITPFVDAVNVTDCPMYNLRMNSIVSASIIKNSLNLETIFNLTCRDRNELAISSDLLGAWSLGLDNVLAINGDAILDNLKENVYKVNTYKLVEIIDKLNRGVNYRNKSIDLNTDFFVGVASNIPKKINIKGIANRLKRKESSGAKYIITQPVYSIESLEYFLEAANTTKMYKIIGFFAPPNLKVAKYLDKHVKGIDVPKNLIDRFQDNKDEKQEGFRYIEELLENIIKNGYIKHIDGIHLMRFDKNFVKNLYKAVKGD